MRDLCREREGAESTRRDKQEERDVWGMQASCTLASGSLTHATDIARFIRLGVIECVMHALDFY